jgi:hypothetical protein
LHAVNESPALRFGFTFICEPFPKPTWRSCTNSWHTISILIVRRLALSQNPAGERRAIGPAFVPHGFEMKHAGKIDFYTENLYFLPKKSENLSIENVKIEQIADEVFTIAREGCGLVYALRGYV